MNGQKFKGGKNVYSITKQIGQGGEGQVFEVLSHETLVLKLYNDALDSKKEQKLKYMASLNTSEIQEFAAWPLDVVINSSNNVAGFVMKRLVGYVPLHMLFSPMDRKRIFPDKGYNFLTHVARNLATAFYNLHKQGIIVGDVNEGNILVNALGMVAFIDCDSFQINNGNQYFFCEVGVPRYTPPELLIKGTFDNVIRTENTDLFSMAVLVFQLLFLGRHPFAGKNLSKEDIDEDSAIKTFQFAYSLFNTAKKLQPPDNSFEMRNLSEGLIDLFHKSFEGTNSRPPAGKWVQELNAFYKELVTCTASKLHNYPKKLATCPWCYFQKGKGIIYFIDDSYLQANPITNIEHFVNGFKVEKLSYPKLPLEYSDAHQKPDVIEQKYINYKFLKQLAFVLVLILAIVLSFIDSIFIIPGLLVLCFLNNILPISKILKTELNSRSTKFDALKSQFTALIQQYNSPSELNTFNQVSNRFSDLINSYKKIPIEYTNKKRIIEETLYHEQLHSYLRNFDIRNHPIPSFGANKKLTLYNNGIRNASDVSQLNKIKIYGIGPKNIQILLSWQRQFISQFVYRPDNLRMTAETNKLKQEITAKRNTLEMQIRKEHQSLQYLRASIAGSQQLLESRIKSLASAVYKAELNYMAFKKFIH
jgi:Uncharacterized protein with protein kinase and helix-hairpin-helix DNA-binding domains